MAWVKRNLYFVIGLAVAVALTGAGVWNLLVQMEKSTAAMTNLDEKNTKLDQLVQKNPYPEAKNIAAAKTEQVKLQKFLGETATRFQSNNVLKDLDPQRFQTILLGTIADLEYAATSSGTKLPATDYAFTFSPQRGNTEIPVGKLGDLAAQVEDIRTISMVLFRAKVHALTSMKRVGITTNDHSNPDILTGKKIQTDPDTGAVIRSYEVQFQSFSTELGAVLAGFANTPETVVVRAMNIQKGTLAADSSTTSQPMQNPLAMAGVPRMDPLLAARYGLRPGGMRPPTPETTAATPTPRTGDVVTEEKPIQVSLALDVIKLGVPGAAAPKVARVAPVASDAAPAE